MIHRVESFRFRDVDIARFLHTAKLPEQARVAYCFGPLSTIHNPYHHY